MLTNVMLPAVTPCSLPLRTPNSPCRGPLQTLAARLAEEAEMRRRLELNEKYRYYLQGVVEAGEGEYHEIADVIAR